MDARTTPAKGYGVQKCCCGHTACRTYWLTGIGTFYQGSGFSQEEAERIARLLNADAGLVPDPLQAFLRDVAGLPLSEPSDHADEILNGLRDRALAILASHHDATERAAA